MGEWPHPATGGGRAVVVLDVNETLSDMAPLGRRFADLGLDPALARAWFAGVLRDGFALTAAGGDARFAAIAEAELRRLLDAAAPGHDAGAAVAHVLGGFATLGVHPDVPGGIAALADAGHRVVTLSNGAAAVAERLLAEAGVRDRVEACLSVEAAGAWKPARAAYLHAARACGVAPGDMTMVAVHPWDIDGAVRAGLRTVWISRDGAAYPPHFRPPGRTARGLDALAPLES
ncbi:haloacid dehalogenase type II [Miltoncostaea marina]|uniref:haloacid dehalogenase type II n=1 Tax=Miltoncostaea marina TaxID=2843215 RepID=UPI001C3D7000|nr:haloacid dehalogenase type II [Miltoncostaea marina]